MGVELGSAGRACGAWGDAFAPQYKRCGQPQLFAFFPSVGRHSRRNAVNDDNFTSIRCELSPADRRRRVGNPKGAAAASADTNLGVAPPERIEVCRLRYSDRTLFFNPHSRAAAVVLNWRCWRRGSTRSRGGGGGGDGRAVGKGASCSLKLQRAVLCVVRV